jgi:hypothetical protein
MKDPDLAVDLKTISELKRRSGGKEPLAFICTLNVVVNEFRNSHPDIPAEHLDILERGARDLYFMTFFGQKSRIFAPRKFGSGRCKHPLVDVGRGACLASVDILSAFTADRAQAVRSTARMATRISEILGEPKASTINRWRRDPTTYHEAHQYRDFFLLMIFGVLGWPRNLQEAREKALTLLDLRQLWSAYTGLCPFHMLAS